MAIPNHQTVRKEAGLHQQMEPYETRYHSAYTVIDDLDLRMQPLFCPDAYFNFPVAASSKHK